MKLTFLGSGSAFTVGGNNFHSNMLLENSNRRLLIDCGTDARLSLHKQGLDHRDIQDVYISHLHFDHAGGLEWLAFKTKFDIEQPQKPVLHISEQLIKPLWDNLLSGSLRSIQGDSVDLSTYFDLKPIGKTNTFDWHSITFHLVPTVHVFDNSHLAPSFGLFFLINGIRCFITTDMQFKPEIYDEYYKKADIIFHDCETDKNMSSVHSNYIQLTTLSPEIKAKIWLYHYNPGLLPDAVSDGFRGFVQPGQCFDFFDKSSFEKRQK